MIINALGGLANPNLALGRPAARPADTSRPDIDSRSIAEARASGLTAVNITLGYVAGQEDPLDYTLKTIGAWNEAIAEYPADLVHVLTAGDIIRAQTESRIAVIYGFQNLVQAEGRVENIDLFADRGVRVVQLTYNPANDVGDGCMAVENRGLTAFGREVVARLNERRIMVDLSHSGERTCVEAIAASSAPVSINHTGCRALTDLPRNKSDDELRAVADRGGFVGIYFMPFLHPLGRARAADVVRHIEHAVNVCGEDHVGIGTDGDVTGIDDLAAYAGRLAEEVAERARMGVGAAGERADSYPFVVDLRGVEQFRDLARLLEVRSHPLRRIEKILGGAFLAFAREVWGD